MHKPSGYLILEHLSDIELYFTPPAFVKEEKLFLLDEELHHSVNVMRNSVGDTIYVTDGKGSIYTSEITELKKKELIAKITDKKEFKNKAEKIWFCIPLLKSPDRLKFAFEKCVELGITNFILFQSRFSIPKKLETEKFQKTTLAAMKQSLRTFLPKITSSGFNEIVNLKETKILFDQNVKRVFDGELNFNESIYFIFGPEGGFDDDEIATIGLNNRFNLSTNRLRSETAIIRCASLLNL